MCETSTCGHGVVQGSLLSGPGVSSQLLGSLSFLWIESSLSYGELFLMILNLLSAENLTVHLDL